MNGFYGQFKVNLDPKGRISLPAKIRPKTEDGSSEELILTKGLDGCLALYSKEEWSDLQSRLDELSFTQRDFRYFSRMLYASATPVTPDRQGRFLIPSNLISEASIKREVLILGAYRWIEIWNPEKHKHYLDQFGGSFEDVADRLFGGGGAEGR